MARVFRATESHDLDTVIARLPVLDAWVGRVLARVRPFFDLPDGAAVLDLGAAQGATVTAYTRAGFATRGVEPWEPAIEISRALAVHTGIPLDIAHGTGEALPFADESFDFIHANSVMEHVDDPWQVFREAYRTLKPGGAFLFSTSSNRGLRQNEIGRFPLFAWYPQRVQSRITAWALKNRPSLVGYTTRPAIHWFKHAEVKVALAAVGYRQIVDRWTMRSASREAQGARRLIVDIAARVAPARVILDTLLGGVEYLAIK